jgi:rhodanese-related sulfurtransferase
MSWAKDLRAAAVLLAAATALGVIRVLVAGGTEAFAGPPPPVETTCLGETFAPAAMPRISVADARGLVGQTGVTFVDARPAEAYRSGHVPTAISLPAYDAAGLLEVQSVPIPPADRVITYCDGALQCDSSERLGLLLRDNVGCRSIEVLEGGLSAWVAAGAPVVTEEER